MDSLEAFSGRGKGVDAIAVAARGACEDGGNGGLGEDRLREEAKSSGSSSMRAMVVEAESVWLLYLVMLESACAKTGIVGYKKQVERKGLSPDSSADLSHPIKLPISKTLSL